MKKITVLMKGFHSMYKPILFFWLIIFAVSLMTGCKQETPVQSKYPNGRNDAWGFVGAGGGGAQFSPTVSPFNHDYVFVRCDMSGAYVTYNGGETWRMFNLRGTISFYVFDPKDENVIYAKSTLLYRSTDKGKTWTVLYPAPSEAQSASPAGSQAAAAAAPGSRGNIQTLAIDPSDSKKLYASISIDRTTGLFTSDDWGKTWKKEKDLTESAKNIFIVPSSPRNDRTIYLTGRNTITSRIKGTWKTNNGPEGVNMLTKYEGGYDKKMHKFIIYAISGNSYFNKANEKSGIYYTDNGGETWENREAGLVKFKAEGAPVPEWRSLGTSYGHPQVLYISYDRLKIDDSTTCIGVAKSEDYGKTWTLAWQDKREKFSPNFEIGWLDYRFGPGWGENPFALGVSPTNPDVCYGTDFGRTVRTIDGGKTWHQLYTKKKEGGGWTSRGLEVTTVYTIVFDPFDTSHAFICTTDIGLMESKDGTASWMNATVDNGVPRSWRGNTYWIAFDPEVKGKAWAVMSGTHDLPYRNGTNPGLQGGVLMSEDNEKTWQIVSGDIGEAAMTHIFIDPTISKDSRTLYACAFAKGVYKSIDGGKTWKQKNKGIVGKDPFAWRIFRRDKDGALFLVVCKRPDQDGAIYKSINGAESWTKMTLPEAVNSPISFALDPQDPERLLLSAFGGGARGQAESGGGIFMTKDEGKTWTHPLKDDQRISDITFDPRNKTYYTCSFGEGSAYRSEDQGETWKRIRGYNFRSGKRVDIDPRNPDKIFVITFGGGVWYGPAKGDPDAVEDIVNPVAAY